MNKFGVSALVAASSLAMATPSQAAVTFDGTVDPFSVDYIFFSFVGGDLSITTSPFGSPSLNDPMISLFRDDGSSAPALTGALLGTDDDSAGGLSALLNFNGLSSGNYVLAVGAFALDESEARSGIASTPDGVGNYRTVFSSATDVQVRVASAVPEPGTWMMMLLGFAAVGMSVRRRRKLAFA